MRNLTYLLASLCMLQLTTLHVMAEDGLRETDSRTVQPSLPDDMQPWWPSRYGNDDTLGTLNEINTATILNSLKLVQQGKVINLGRILDEQTPKFPGRYWHQSIDTSPHFINQRRPNASAQGWGKNAINWITEIQVGTFQVGTQLDSIGHIQIGNRFYNGWTTTDIVAENGLKRFGIESVPPIIGRGILLDIARYKNVRHLAAGYVITLSDIKQTLHSQNISVKAGDIVLLHTGWGSFYAKDNSRFLSGEPGPGMDVIEWMYQQRIAAIGTDTWSIGPVPGEDPDRPFLVPQTMYVKMGLFGLENLATEELAAHGVYEFLFVNTHARTRGSTAAVIAPAAIF